MLLLALPFIGIFAGFIAGALIVAIYNLIASAIGGIERSRALTPL